MSLFKDVINLWKADDLLSQSWDESYKMLNLSHEIFQQALIYLRNGENIDSLKALKKRDKEINEYYHPMVAVKKHKYSGDSANTLLSYYYKLFNKFQFKKKIIKIIEKNLTTGARE